MELNIDGSSLSLSWRLNFWEGKQRQSKKTLRIYRTISDLFKIQIIYMYHIFLNTSYKFLLRRREREFAGVRQYNGGQLRHH